MNSGRLAWIGVVILVMSSDSCALTDSSTAETFTLTHVRNAPVPMTWSLNHGYRSEFVEGFVRFGPLHRFYQEIRHRETDNGVVVADSFLKLHGRFVRDGTTLRVVYLQITEFGKGYSGRTYELEPDGATVRGLEAFMGADIGVFTYVLR